LTAPQWVRVCALAPLVVGCGSLESGERLDRPTFSMKGTISPAPSDREVAPSDLRIGLLWIDPVPGEAGSWTSGRELVTASIGPDGTFTMDLRGLPPDAAVRALDVPGSTEHLAYAFSELVLYEDRDGDGRFNVGPLAEGSPMIGTDVYRGMPTTALLFYVRDPLPPDASSQLPELMGVLGERGYHLGVVNCGTSTVSAFEPAAAVLTLTPPSPLFPDLRRCLRSHPTEPPNGGMPR
jgi:hypothetical protein